MTVGIVLDSLFLSSLKTIRKRKKIIVLTTNTSSTYYYGTDGPKGMEYELATLFARSLGVEVEFRIKHNINEVLQAIQNGEGDIAAAGMTRTRERLNQYLFGPTYYEVTQYVVGKRFGILPRSMEELLQFKPVIVAGTSFEENLKRLKKSTPDWNGILQPFYPPNRFWKRSGWERSMSRFVMTKSFPSTADIFRN